MPLESWLTPVVEQGVSSSTNLNAVRSGYLTWADALHQSLSFRPPVVVDHVGE